MSITKSKYDRWELTGLSTDVKWTDSEMPAGSIFTETDTGRKFTWDGSSWKGGNFPIGAITATANFTLTSVTAGNTISATFTMPAGGIFETAAFIAKNPATCALTCSLYHQELFGTAMESCLIDVLTIPSSTNYYQQVIGTFLDSNLLVQISPNADCNTASGTLNMKIRGVRGPL